MIVDLRSDTVTKPTSEMYVAMASCPLGDDVLADEPTVTELESEVAAILGKPAAVFVPSGTMGNQIAIASHTRPGDAILAEEDAHILYYEVAAPAVLSGVLTRGVASHGGVMDPAEVDRKALQGSLHTPATTLLCLENTNNRAGGTVIPLATHAEYRKVADRHAMKIHLDGARLWNAAVATAKTPAEFASTVDSVTVCLSKGLAAPVGSVLAGEAEFIQRARIWRKRLGGGMRQAGILAACGLVAVRNMVDRLAEDHRRARALTDALEGLPGLKPIPAQTNIVIIETDRPSDDWVTGLESGGIRCFAFGPHRVRLVFHKDVEEFGLEQTINQFRKLAVAFA